MQFFTFPQTVNKNQAFYLLIILSTLVSCRKDKNDANPEQQKYSVKSEVVDGKITSRFIYNNAGKISEWQSLYFFSKYIYDTDDRLIKSESDHSLTYSSLAPPPKTELMNSGNTEFTSYQVFEYDRSGILVKVINYSKKNDFVNTSSYTFDYIRGRIAKRNLLNADGRMTQFNTYEYDANGNIAAEKYYSNLNGPEPELISETTYKYDDKNNPFKVFEASGSPGLFSNSNNIIETQSISYQNTPGADKSSSSKTSYQYNNKNYPVKVVSGNTEYELRYE